MFGEHMNFASPQHPWTVSTAYSDHSLPNKRNEESQCDKLRSEFLTIVFGEAASCLRCVATCILVQVPCIYANISEELPNYRTRWRS